MGLWHQIHSDRWDPIEADFLTYYGLELAAELEERPSRAMRLIRQLPAGSALGRSETNGIPWSWEKEALATVLELQQAQIVVALGAAGVKEGKLPRLEPIPRPWADRTPRPPGTPRPRHRKRRHATAQEAVAIVGRALGGRP